MSDSFGVAFNADEDSYDDLADEPVRVEPHEGAVKLR